MYSSSQIQKLADRICDYQATKDKSTPTPKELQAWSGPEGSRKLRLPDFMTSDIGTGRW